MCVHYMLFLCGVVYFCMGVSLELCKKKKNYMKFSIVFC